MKEKKGGFLRWPWNVVVYAALLVLLRAFAVPIILILLAVQRKNNPNGAEEGYCLTRTRKRLSWVLWGALWIVISAGMFYMFHVGLQQDPAYRETADYVTLAFCGGGGLLLLLLGLYMGYAGGRDCFFPARSSLADSIRSQLPYPEEAPPVGELFAMVDRDLEANGQWFDAVGIGQEWVLGEQANRIDRIRGIFTVDKIRHRHSGNRTTTTRIMQLVLVDDRWQKHITDFKKSDELRAAADCLSLRVPEARRGVNDQWTGFWNMDESEREDFERDFRQRRNRRASQAAQREILSEGSQDMILKRRDGAVTSRVSASLVREELKRCLDGEESGFELTPTRPIAAGNRTLRSLNCFVRGGGEPGPGPVGGRAAGRRHPGGLAPPGGSGPDGLGPAAGVCRPPGRRIRDAAEVPGQAVPGLRRRRGGEPRQLYGGGHPGGGGGPCGRHLSAGGPDPRLGLYVDPGDGGGQNGRPLHRGGHEARGRGAGLLYGEDAAQGGGGVADGVSPRRIPAGRPGLEAGQKTKQIDKGEVPQWQQF